MVYNPYTLYRERIMKCLLCENPVKRTSSKFCSRSCATKYRAKDKNRIPKESLIQDYKIDRMTWNDLCKKHNVSLLTLKRYIEKYEIGFNNDFDFVNKKIGKLTIEGKSYIKNTKQYWKCKCECGREYHTTSGVLLRSKTISCEECRYLDHRETDIIKSTLWNHYIEGAKRRNFEFSITKEYAYELFIKQKGKCALSGVYISFSTSQGSKSRALTTASLDRIDSKRGYTKDNVQWVHKKINRIKNNMPNQEFIDWCILIGKWNDL